MKTSPLIASCLALAAVWSGSVASLAAADSSRPNIVVGPWCMGSPISRSDRPTLETASLARRSHRPTHRSCTGGPRQKTFHVWGTNSAEIRCGGPAAESDTVTPLTEVASAC